MDLLKISSNDANDDAKKKSWDAEAGEIEQDKELAQGKGRQQRTSFSRLVNQKSEGFLQSESKEAIVQNFQRSEFNSLWVQTVHQKKLQSCYTCVADGCFPLWEASQRQTPDTHRNGAKHHWLFLSQGATVLYETKNTQPGLEEVFCFLIWILAAEDLQMVIRSFRTHLRCRPHVDKEWPNKMDNEKAKCLAVDV